MGKPQRIHLRGSDVTERTSDDIGSGRDVRSSKRIRSAVESLLPWKNAREREREKEGKGELETPRGNNALTVNCSACWTLMTRREERWNV